MLSQTWSIGNFAIQQSILCGNKNTVQTTSAQISAQKILCCSTRYSQHNTDWTRRYSTSSHYGTELTEHWVTELFDKSFTTQHWMNTELLNRLPHWTDWTLSYCYWTVQWMTSRKAIRLGTHCIELTEKVASQPVFHHREHLLIEQGAVQLVIHYTALTEHCAILPVIHITTLIEHWVVKPVFHHTDLSYSTSRLFTAQPWQNTELLN